MTSNAPPARIVETVGTLRSLGFFADRVGTVEDVAASILDDHRAMWGGDPDDHDALFGLGLLRFDPQRVWWEDTEADVGPGNDAYVTAISAWARISRGALHPASLDEDWESPQGPVRIRLVQDGALHTLTARYLDDYLDLGVLDGLNGVIVGGPYRFRLYAPFDQTAFVIACDERERRLLEERGWSFVVAT